MPRPQRRIFATPSGKLWTARRSRRGFSNTTKALLAPLLVFVHTHLAHAQAPSEVRPTPGAAEPVSPNWSRRLALSHFERALELERRADIAQALREYTESIAIDSTLGEAYLRLGALRERMGDPREAALVYSEAVRLGDSRARALLQRSRLERVQGLSAQALQDLEASVELEPSRDALTELSHYYVEAHAWSAALSAFRRIASLASADGDPSALAAARLEVQALRVLAAETDPCTEPAKKHDWVARALIHIAQH